MERLKRVFPYLWIAGSFGLLDVWIRVMTRWIGLYSIFEIAPNLFTLLWSLLLTVVVTIPRKRKNGRILYGAVFLFYLLYAVVQYGSYLILGKFLYVSEFLNAGEGATYTDYAVRFITPGMIGQILFMIGVGVLSILLYPANRMVRRHTSAIVRSVTAAFCSLGIFLTPQLYTESENTWKDFRNPAFEYNKFINPNADLELTGIFQFLARDVHLQVARELRRSNVDTAPVDTFFAERGVQGENAMSGIFEGKNLLVFMLESVDDFLITEEDTPTMYMMMTHGINFTNMYTPAYASGHTFNTEFAFNTGTYPYSNGNVTYALADSDFSSGLASVCAEAGYSVNSFHKGLPSFYNRGIMHEAFGYEKYHSYYEYEGSFTVEDDGFLVDCDALYEDLTGTEPFYSFVITYSAHLPYTDEDALCRYALTKYPQYDVQEDREYSILKAKTRLTDDMFTRLLERLEEDNLLENTVIVCFTDHYAYGIMDAQKLCQLSESAGSTIVEKTPAFVYCADWDRPMTVNKVMQTIDLSPTLLNMMGLESAKQVMGQDIFDEDYTGYAVFAGNTWLTNTTYVKNGSVVWNRGMTQEEIAEMNRFVLRFYDVNDLILDSDYYASKDN